MGSCQTKKIESSVSTFETIIADLPIRYMNALHGFMAAISKATHFIGSVRVWQSWVYLRICAISLHSDDWAEKPRTNACFSTETISNVQEMVLKRWNGSEPGVGLQHVLYILSCILEPYTCSHVKNSPKDEKASVQNFLTISMRMSKEKMQCRN